MTLVVFCICTEHHFRLVQIVIDCQLLCVPHPAWYCSCYERRGDYACMAFSIGFCYISENTVFSGYMRTPIEVNGESRSCAATSPFLAAATASRVGGVRGPPFWREVGPESILWICHDCLIWEYPFNQHYIIIGIQYNHDNYNETKLNRTRLDEEFG